MSQFIPFMYGQITVGSTPTALVAKGQNSKITLVNHGTNDVFLGDANVTTSTGVLLAGTKGTSLKITTTGAVYGVTASTQVVSVLTTAA